MLVRLAESRAGRWSEHAKTKHGGNKRLVELITADADYCNEFQISVLEAYSIKRDRHKVLEDEQLYNLYLSRVPTFYFYKLVLAEWKSEQ